MQTSISTISARPLEILQNLVRFDTTNPPGNEAPCISYLRNLLSDAGIESELFARSPGRPNMIARLGGSGSSSPLMLYGHVDVVTTAGQNWRYPPFEGEIADGFLWGRGTLDMKGAIAMMVAAVLQAKEQDTELPGDVVLCVVCDEEAGGAYGAKWMVENHAHQFEGIRHALGEFGGFSLNIGEQRLYPIMIAEKQICRMKVTFRGPAGHGSMPIRGGAMAKLAAAIQKMESQRLPVHITEPARLMFESMAASQSMVTRQLIRLMLKPMLTNRVLDLLGDRTRVFDPLLHNTVCPNIVHGGEKINVIPSQVSLELDGRLLPGYGPDDMVVELQALLGPHAEIDVVDFNPGPSEVDMDFFETLADLLQETDPAGIPIPLLLSGVTDARYFSRLGIHTYGFTPMQLPEDFNFSETIHAADERIPLEAVDFGTQAIFQAIQCPRS